MLIVLVDIPVKRPAATVLLTVVIFVVFVTPELLTVVKYPIFVTTELLTVPILVAFVTPELLTVVRFVVTVPIFVAFVTPALLTVKTAPLLGIEVNKEASPANLPKIVPAEIVEKNPKLVDVVIAE